MGLKTNLAAVLQSKVNRLKANFKQVKQFNQKAVAAVSHVPFTWSLLVF